MKKITTHKIDNDVYTCLVTVLYWDIVLERELSKITIKSYEGDKKILVDLALANGMNRYRFGEFDVGSDGKILVDGGRYVMPERDIVELADGYLREEAEALSNSILPEETKAELLKAPDEAQDGQAEAEPFTCRTHEPA